MITMGTTFGKKGKEERRGEERCQFWVYFAASLPVESHRSNAHYWVPKIYDKILKVTIDTTTYECTSVVLIHAILHIQVQ